MNPLAVALRRHRASGRPLLDLTVTNPTTVEIPYPAGLLDPLAKAEGMRYAPAPFGLAEARAAVGEDYRRRGLDIPADRIVLTASTSEAYSLLLKLLCESHGDDVLVPAPSYPLFDHLTRLDGVEARPYALEYHGRWEVDRSSADAAWTPRTRAVLAVSPNNPTGSVLTQDELGFLESRCAARGTALILDEVFADYPLGRGGPVGPRGPVGPALTFRLGGLSKSAGLPQVKLGWIAVSGPDDLVRAALERLEMICDTYLSVSTPVQVAAPALIEGGAEVRGAIQRRIRGNYARLSQLTALFPSVQLLQTEAGWSTVLRIPRARSEEDAVISLLEEQDTLVHPGFFFDFPTEAFLVLSLLPHPETFAEGVRRLLEHVHA